MDEATITPRLAMYLDLQRRWTLAQDFGDDAGEEALAFGMDAVWKALDQAERLILDARRTEMM